MPSSGSSLKIVTLIWQNGQRTRVSPLWAQFSLSFRVSFRLHVRRSNVVDLFQKVGQGSGDSQSLLSILAEASGTLRTFTALDGHEGPLPLGLIVSVLPAQWDSLQTSSAPSLLSLPPVGAGMEGTGLRDRRIYGDCFPVSLPVQLKLWFCLVLEQSRWPIHRSNFWYPPLSLGEISYLRKVRLPTWRRLCVSYGHFIKPRL